MLTKKQMDRITTEEIFRNELKQQLAKLDKKESKLWTTVNSGFFLWLMSTIVIGIVSFGYSIWDKSREEQRKKDEAVQIVEREKRLTARKIDVEISNRLIYFGHMLQGSTIPPKAILTLENPSTADYPINVFPEFERRTLQSLLWELLQVAPENEINDIKLAYEESKNLSALFLGTESSYSSESLEDAAFAFTKNLIAGDDVEQAQQAAANILEKDALEKRNLHLSKFNLARWGTPFNKALAQKTIVIKPSTSTKSPSGAAPNNSFNRTRR